MERVAADPGPPLRLHHADPPLGVAILGAGFAGIGMAIGLLGAGRRDFLVFEKHASIGGTWRDNTYPGCGCDVPSHLYSFSFAPHAGWSHTYAPQPEILAYLHRVADRPGVRERIRLDTPIVALDWDEGNRCWELTAADGSRYRARVVVSAVGGLHLPQLPDIAGLASFTGPAFHTARWRHDVPLTGRRVAVIGTGASGVQVIPEIAARAGRLHVFQRTPSWILPRPGGGTTRPGRWLAAHTPGLAWLRRTAEFWRAETAALGFAIKPKLVERGQKRAIRFLERSIADRELVRRLWPNYALGCKRVLLSNDFYPALLRDTVELVTEPIARFTPRSVVTQDGREREIDVAILATGFRPFDITAGLRITGRGGRCLREDWRRGPEAFRGVAVTGFPNLFLLMGPNTALGHNSIVFMIETQVRYVLRCLSWLARGEAEVLDVRDDVQEAFNRDLEARFARSVWQSTTWQSGKGWHYRPCGSWYRHASGRNHVLWPGSAAAYWIAMRRATLADYRTTAITAPAAGFSGRSRAA